MLRSGVSARASVLQQHIHRADARAGARKTAPRQTVPICPSSVADPPMMVEAAFSNDGAKGPSCRSDYGE